MTTNDRFGTLQARWAAGEALSADEDRERLEAAVGDPLAERELALFDALKERGEGVDPLPRGFIDRVLDAAGARPRLHLLSPGERPPATRKPPARARRIALVAAAASLIVAGVTLSAILLRAKPTPEARLVVPNTAPRSVRAELVLASGDVTLPDGARVGGKPFAPGDRLSTDEGRACLGIDPGIDVCLGAHSEIYVESLRAESVRLRVERGTALAALTHREPGHEFSLTTESVTVTARGTVFAVERRAGHELDVVVMEGTVEVAAPSSP
ncbi:MAG TPA: FecR domain-containing protein, partial [Polyangiaceae bacterium]|nr:FecR domain-containing protein [Polyangiaceae bacterium]